MSFTDSALEEYKDNYNKAVCQFMDAMRKKYGKELRHFYVMEYGTETGRPHYHGILFGVKHLDFFDVESLWNRGNGRVRNPNVPFEGFFRKPRGIIYLEYIRSPEKLSSYLCKYLTKEYYPDRPTPRVLTSRGLGLSFFKDNSFLYFKQNLTPVTSFCGFPYVLPLYYRNKIFSTEDKIRMVDKAFMNPRPYHLEGKLFYNKEDFEKARKLLNRRHIELGLSPHPTKQILKKPRKRRSNAKSIAKAIPYEFKDFYHEQD